MSSAGSDGTLPAVAVLTSFPSPRATTNPYIVQLARALEAETGVSVTYFSWRAALTGRYDVVHAHWPETWLEGRTRLRRLVRLGLAVLLCLRLTVTRTPVVRTWHNLDRPSGLWRVDYGVLAWLERLTRVRIRLNELTELPPARTVDVTIPHGHYRDWYAPYDRSPAVAGSVCFVGRIRRYKGVEDLIEVFAALPDPTLRLTVAGMPSSDDLVEVATSLRAGDDRIHLRFEYVDDATLVRTVTAASLVVLPYRHMHNSGTVLAALSLDRPVLVPDNEVNRRLAQEVGAPWVLLYEGDLEGDDLSRGLAAAADLGGSPDLSAREWHSTGEQHHRAYAAALGARG